MKRFLLSIYLGFISIITFSQIDNTMYFMDRLPQASYLNAANYPECKLYVGGLLVPIFGQLPPSMGFAVNTPIDYNDIFFKGRWEYSDSIITPLHPNADIEDFFNKLKPVNYTSLDFQLSLLHFGFKQGENNFWSFDWSERTYMQFGLPENLLRFPIQGNGEVRNGDFTGLHINAFQYRQIAIGYRRKVSRYFNVGARFKFLTGIANVYTSSSSLIINTEDRTAFISSSSNYVIHTNAPIDVTLDDNGFVDAVNFKDFANESSNQLIKDYALFTGNRGYALDFGFSKDWSSEITYFASVEDFGFIRWKNNTSTFSLIGDESNDGGFNFTGVEMNNLNFSNLSIFPEGDSLLNYFDFNYSQDAYTTWLPLKMYAGVRYKVVSKLWIGALGRFERLTYGYRPSYTGTLNFRPGKFGQFTLSYSYINKNFNNIGFGYALPLGPFQWYMVTDNLAGIGLFPDNSRSASLRMGCNLIFGYKEKKGNRAMPLFNSKNSNNGRKLPNSGYKKPKRKSKNTGSVEKTKKRGAIGAPEN